jgi:hypothetical protein
MRLVPKVLVTMGLAVGLLGFGSSLAHADTYVPGPVQDTVTSVPAPPDAGKPQSGNLPQTGADGRMITAWTSFGMAALLLGGVVTYEVRRTS